MDFAAGARDTSTQSQLESMLSSPLNPLHSLQEQLCQLYPRLKVLAFGAKPESTLHTYFPSFLSRATPGCPPEMKKEVRTGGRCLSPSWGGVRSLSADRPCHWEPVFSPLRPALPSLVPTANCWLPYPQSMAMLIPKRRQSPKNRKKRWGVSFIFYPGACSNSCPSSL